MCCILCPLRHLGYVLQLPSGIEGFWGIRHTVTTSDAAPTCVKEADEGAYYVHA